MLLTVQRKFDYSVGYYYQHHALPCRLYLKEAEQRYKALEQGSFVSLFFRLREFVAWLQRVAVMRIGNIGAGGDLIHNKKRGETIHFAKE